MKSYWIFNRVSCAWEKITTTWERWNATPRWNRIGDCGGHGFVSPPAPPVGVLIPPGEGIWAAPPDFTPSYIPVDSGAGPGMGYVPAGGGGFDIAPTVKDVSFLHLGPPDLFVTPPGGILPPDILPPGILPPDTPLIFPVSEPYMLVIFMLAVAFILGLTLYRRGPIKGSR